MKKRLLFIGAAICALAGSNAMAQRYVTNVFSDVTVTSDIKYGENFSVLTGAPVLSDLMMDFYEPTGDAETARPLIIYLHTGSFLPKGVNQMPTGSRSDSAVVEMCSQFAKKGYAVAAVGYRLGWNPQGDQDTRTGTIINAVYRAMQDAKVAVRHFRATAAANSATYKIDTNKIVLCGQGSGGYVALAYATLDKLAEIHLQKFINANTNEPYVKPEITGDFDGFNGHPQANKGDNYPGFSSEVNMAINLGGAMGDSSWLEAGDIPIACVHGIEDPFAPYTTGGVYVPGANLFVVEVSGGRDIARRADRLGVNDILKTPPFTDPVTIASNNYNEGLPALFPISGAANGSAPWEWWDANDPFSANGLLSNPLMSKARALLYIDTLQNFFAPRMARVLGLSTGIENTLNSTAAVKLYPNPANDRLTIEFKNFSTGDNYSVEILDATGRVIIKEADIAINNKTINTAALNSGMYYVKIISGKESRVEKLLINR